MQVLFQSGNQRFNPTGNSAVNSSQVSMSPSMTRVSPFKTFAITRSSHQLLSINSSLAIMDSVTSVRKLRTNTGLKTNTVSDDHTVNGNTAYNQSHNYYKLVYTQVCSYIIIMTVTVCPCIYNR